jgi:hypothetical protein
LAFDNETERKALEDLRASASFKQANTEEKARLVAEARGRGRGENKNLASAATVKAEQAAQAARDRG